MEGVIVIATAAKEDNCIQAYEQQRGVASKVVATLVLAGEHGYLRWTFEPGVHRKGLDSIHPATHSQTVLEVFIVFPRTCTAGILWTLR